MNENEPSVWDYIKAKLTPWKGPAPSLPPAEAPGEEMLLGETPAAEAPPEGVRPKPVELAGTPPRDVLAQTQTGPFPWRSLLVVFLALAAQWSLEPRPNRSPWVGIVLYILAFGWLVWTSWIKEWIPADKIEGVKEEAKDISSSSFVLRPVQFILAIILGLAAFWFFKGNLFTKFNVFLWVTSLVFLIWSFWQGHFAPFSWLRRLGDFVRRPSWRVDISRWMVLVLGVVLLVVFFRVYRLDQVPNEMVSDHAEKLLDIGDVLRGQTSIFFPRNTGREGFQMYLTAAIVKLFDTGLSFISLKIGTTIAGLITLVYMYLLGKEVGNRRVGLLAMLFTGIAYWPNVITRVALRFTLYPFFLALALYYLFHGIRRSRPNDFILAGLMVGLGLHGYSPFRVVPFLIVVAVGIFAIHRQSKENRALVLKGLVVLALVALFVFLPLFRYALENPQMFNYRTLTRVGSLERPLPGPAWQIFLKNSWNAITMYFWSDGEIWPISVTNRPALDIVSGALLLLGATILLVRYIRRRTWLDLFLLLSVYILMLPSIMSLAFPAENPAVNRAAGAMVPAFLIVGIALDGLLTALQSRIHNRTRTRLAWCIGIFLVLIASTQNYDLVFRQYQRSYELSAWNTSEMGQIIRDFTQTIGTRDSAWVVGYPYWVDTRLVGINAGYPEKDYAVMPDQLDKTVGVPGAKLFLINLQDVASMDFLRNIYPSAWVQEYQSRIPDKEFYMLFVPPSP
jgi:hypothetical protein